MKKNVYRKKIRRGSSRNYLCTGVVCLGLAAVVATWTLQAQEHKSSSFAWDDERNQLAESVGPEIYNASAYAKMEKEILDSIKTDSSLSEESMQVDVSAEEGVVILKGVVKNSHDKGRIVELAKEPAGMARIDNQLKVGSLE